MLISKIIAKQTFCCQYFSESPHYTLMWRFGPGEQLRGRKMVYGLRVKDVFHGKVWDHSVQVYCNGLSFIQCKLSILIFGCGKKEGQSGSAPWEGHSARWWWWWGHSRWRRCQERKLRTPSNGILDVRSVLAERWRARGSTLWRKEITSHFIEWF